MNSNALNAIAISTLGNMPGNKGLPPQMAAHVVRAVEEIIKRHFSDADGNPRSERVIAKGIGISQPVLHSVRKGKGIGIHALLALRKYTGQSIDALLGLDASHRTDEPPPPKKRKAKA